MEPHKPVEHLALEPPRELENLNLYLYTRSCGETVPHILFTPLHYEPRYAYPLLVWLHGPGATERQLIRIMPKISLRNYVAIAIRGVESKKSRSTYRLKELTAGGTKARYGWPQNPDGIAEAAQRVFRAIEFACAKRHVHPNRIFLVGSRCGGTMAFRLALQEPSYFAGIVSLGGPLPQGRLLLRNFSKLGHLEVLVTVCRNDPFYPTSLVCENLRLLYRAGLAGTMFREYPAGWHLSVPMLRDVDRWLMERITQGASCQEKL
ncbi:MAG: hypothetical protein NZ602_08145 [Thermoguttaceae bacterium]|nr:hypothetical protein [Thermoguttaceae bacterium]MDW8037251.1 hypothetical protein [Thermoguttaceae bacterium]